MDRYPTSKSTSDSTPVTVIPNTVYSTSNELSPTSTEIVSAYASVKGTIVSRTKPREIFNTKSALKEGRDRLNCNTGMM